MRKNSSLSFSTLAIEGAEDQILDPDGVAESFSRLLGARIVVRAFGFFPPARAASRQLVLGLETAADDAAVREIGDPVVVARALLRLVEGSRSGASLSTLGVSESHVMTHVRRLTTARVAPRRALGSLVTALTVVLVTCLVVVLPATRRTVSAAAQVLQAPDRKHTTVESDRGWTATVWHSESVHKAVIVTKDMPPAPDGKVYQLWLRPAGGRFVSAGLLPSGPDQSVRLSPGGRAPPSAANT